MTSLPVKFKPFYYLIYNRESLIKKIKHHQNRYKTQKHLREELKLIYKLNFGMLGRASDKQWTRTTIIHHWIDGHTAFHIFYFGFSFILFVWFRSQAIKNNYDVMRRDFLCPSQFTKMRYDIEIVYRVYRSCYICCVQKKSRTLSNQE